MFGSTALLVLLAGVLFSAVAYAQVHPLTDLPGPGDITTGVFFPEHATHKFTAGKPVTAVLGLHNDGNEPYNVSAILGSLNSPTDFRMHIQNFTQMVYMQVVAPGEDLSFEYTFTPDYRLDARDFTVALTVVYTNAAQQYFSNTFFNATIEVVEQKVLIDYEMLSLVMLLAVAASAAVYLAYNVAMLHLQNIGLVKKSKKAKVEAAPKALDTDEWLKGTAYDSFRKKKLAEKSKQ